MADFTQILAGFQLPNVSGSDIVNNLALGALTSAVSLGVQAKLAQDFPGLVKIVKGDPATNNAPSAVGATITASAFAALPAGAQAQLIASGVHIVAG